MRYHDERLRWLQENFSYIDSVTMIDATGKITVKERYNPRYSDAENVLRITSGVSTATYWKCFRP